MNDKKMPPINYIGNKEKISSWIVDMFPIEKGRILDVFSGGSSVSFEAKKRKFEVITNDALYASFVVSKAIIENKSVKLEEAHILKALEKPLDLKRRNELSFLENNLYYDYEVDELCKLISYSERNLEKYEKYIFQSLIRRSMIRKLPYSRMNIDWDNIKKLRDEDYSYQKYGRRRAYHNISFSEHMLGNLNKYNEAIFDNLENNKAYHSDVFTILKEIDEVDLIYLDPPYPGTMNRYDNFYGKFDEIFNKQIEYTDITKGKFFLNFIEDFLEKAKDKTKYIILSLNTNSIPNISELYPMFSKYGSVIIEEKKHNYQVSGKKTKNTNKEILLILTYF